MNTPSLWRGLPAVHTSRTCIRGYQAQKGPAGGPPNHGERIWVFNHWTTGQIVYSLKPVLDSNKAMRQLPFNGKKTKPAKLRKDYWRPMAVICFRPKFDRGIVGRSVFQMLREFRKLHELAWGDELLKSKKERGQLLNDQRKNAVADMAAVLAGRGRGNRICEANNPPLKPWYQKPAPNSKRLYKATILWANKADRMYAREWTGNVTHDIMKEWHKDKCLNDLRVIQEQAEKAKADGKTDKTQEEKSVEGKSVGDKNVEEKNIEEKSVEERNIEEKSVEEKNVEEKNVEQKNTEEKEKNIEKTDQAVDATVEGTGAPAVDGTLMIEGTGTRQPKMLLIPPPESVSDDKESEAAALIALAHDIEAEAKRLAWENDPDRDLWSPDDEDKTGTGANAKDQGEGGSNEIVPAKGNPAEGVKEKSKAEA